MSVQHHLLGISGSLRKTATNRTLLAEAARLFNAATYTQANLDLPLYNGDAEDASGIPATVQTLADQLAAADAVIISTPEYNSALSGVLKNALDWISRTDGNPWRDKPVAIMSAAAGRSGGARALSSLRLCMAPFRSKIIPGPEILIAGSGKAFDDTGHLLNEHSIKSLTELMQQLRAEIS
ncbi:MAG: NAD(P)H-dependent oxidoreductase [Paracoccaceae bacterium]